MLKGASFPTVLQGHFCHICRPVDRFFILGHDINPLILSLKVTVN